MNSRLLSISHRPSAISDISFGASSEKGASPGENEEKEEKEEKGASRERGQCLAFLGRRRGGIGTCPEKGRFSQKKGRRLALLPRSVAVLPSPFSLLPDHLHGGRRVGSGEWGVGSGEWRFE